MGDTELLRTLTLNYVENVVEFYKNSNNVRRGFAYNCIANVIRAKKRNPTLPIDFYTTLGGMTRDKIIFIFTTFKYCLEIKVFAMDPRRISAKRAIYKAIYTTNRITRVLLSTDVVFRDVDEHLCSTVREAVDNRRLLILAIEISDVHSMHPSVIKNMDIQIPEEVYVKQVEEDDAELIISTHDYLFPPSTDFFRKLIRFYGGYGLCSKENNELLSWGLITTGGTIDYVGTVDKAKRKNYARTIIKLLAKELIFWEDQKVIGIFKELLAEDEIFLSVCGFMKLSIPDHYMTLYCTPSRVLHIWEIPIRSKPLPYPLIDLEPPVFEEASSSYYETSKKSHIPVSRTISDGNESPVTNLQEIPDTCIPRPNYDDDDPSIARPRPLNWKPRKCYMMSDEDELSDAYNEEDLPEEKPTEGKTNPLKAKFEKLKKFGKSILIAVATKLRKPDNEDSSESEDISIEYYFTDEIVQASNDLMEIRPISPSTCTRPSTLTEWLLTRKTIKENERKEALKRQSIVEFTVEPIPSTPGPSNIPIGTQSSTKSKSSTKLTSAIKKMIISPSTATTSSKSIPGSSTASKSTGAISRVTRSSKLTGGDTCKLIGTKPTISKVTISAITKTTGPIRKPARKSVEPGICEMPDLVTTRNYDETTRRLVTRKKTLEKTTTVDKKGKKDKKKTKQKDKDK